MHSGIQFPRTHRTVTPEMHPRPQSDPKKSARVVLSVAPHHLQPLVGTYVPVRVEKLSVKGGPLLPALLLAIIPVQYT